MKETWKILTKEVGSRRERVCVVMLATAVFMLIANGYSWFEFYPVHDGINHWLDEFMPMYIRRGRFLTNVYLIIRGYGSMPFITGLLSILFLGISICVVTALFLQKTRIELVLTSAFLSANFFMVECNTGQQYFCDFFLCAMMFGCLGVYFVLRKRNWQGFLASVGLFFVSFGLYPAFITFSVCILVTGILLKALRGEGNKLQVWRELVLGFSSIAVAGLVYLLTARIVCAVTGYEPSNEAAFSIFTLGKQETQFYVNRLLESYGRFFRPFGFFYLYHRWAIVLSVSLLTALALFFVVRLCVKTRKWGLLALLMLWILLFPLVSRLVNVLSTNNNFRVSYAQFLLCPILVSLVFTSMRCLKVNGCMEYKSYRNVSAAIVMASALIVCANISFTNRAFIVQRLKDERMMFHTGMVMRDYEALKESQKVSGDKLAIVGRFELEANPNTMINLKSINGFHGDTGIVSPVNFGLLVRYLGYKLNWKWVNSENVKDLQDLQEVKEMPCYPHPGYIKDVNGYTVIKLGPIRTKRIDKKKAIPSKKQ